MSIAFDHTPVHDPRKCFGIYLIRNLATGWVYVGSTTQRFSYRWRQHTQLLRENRHDNPHLQHSWNYWGPIWFRFEIAEVLVSKDNVIEREQATVDRLRMQGVDLYNVAPVVENPMKGRHHSDETREKIRRKAIGRKTGSSWNKGIATPAEVRQKISQSEKGRRITPDELQRRIGRKRTPETREKIRASAKRGSDNPATRPEIRAKISASQKARHQWDVMTKSNWLVLIFIENNVSGVQTKQITKSGVPLNSLAKILKKLLRLGLVTKDNGPRYGRYFITVAGSQKLKEYHPGGSL